MNSSTRLRLSAEKISTPSLAAHKLPRLSKKNIGSREVAVMHENDVAQQETAEVPNVEELQAEEFAEEMQAEPKNIDGEPGVSTVEEEAAAEAEGQRTRPDEQTTEL